MTAGGQTGEQALVTTDSSAATWTFREDGTYAIAGLARHTYVEYPGTDTTQTSVYVDDLSASGTFTVSGDDITVVGTESEFIGSETLVYEVSNFSANKRLRLTAAVEETEDFFGVDLGITATQKYTLEQ